MDIIRYTIKEIRVEFNKQELAEILDQYLIRQIGKAPEELRLPGSPTIFIDVSNDTVTLVQQHHTREK